MVDLASSPPPPPPPLHQLFPGGHPAGLLNFKSCESLSHQSYCYWEHYTKCRLGMFCKGSCLTVSLGEGGWCLTVGGDSSGEGWQVKSGEPSREECGVQAGAGIPAGRLGVPLTTTQSGVPLLIKGKWMMSSHTCQKCGGSILYKFGLHPLFHNPYNWGLWLSPLLTK